MRVFNFKDEDIEWLTFYDKKTPNVSYGKHSFFTVDKKLIEEKTGFVIPDGYGLKIFKNHEWQGTDMIDAAVIQNIFWIYGLAPRVIEILQFNMKNRNKHPAFLVEYLVGDNTQNPLALENIALKNHIQINYGGSNLELNNSANWIGGKYLDFGGFALDRDIYKTKLIEKINKTTHYGHLVGEEHISYQSIDDLGVKGKRQTTYRIKEMKLDSLNFINKRVIDVGCNLGLMLHYAKSKGAISLVGYDSTEIIDIAKEYANFREQFEFNFYKQNLIINPPNEKADVVFFLAMSQYLGFPEWLRDITNEVCIYEGHAIDNSEDTENKLKELFPEVHNLGFIKDRGIRPIFICYK